MDTRTNKTACWYYYFAISGCLLYRDLLHNRRRERERKKRRKVEREGRKKERREKAKNKCLGR